MGKDALVVDRGDNSIDLGRVRPYSIKSATAVLPSRP